MLAKKEALAHVNKECLKALYDKLCSIASDVAGVKEVCNALQLRCGLGSYEVSLAVTDTCKIPSIVGSLEGLDYVKKVIQGLYLKLKAMCK